MAVNQQLAQAMARYSVPVQQQMRRSQYLTDALEAMSAPQENIRSPWELAARLAGVAIASRGANKAQDQTAALIRSEKQARYAKLREALTGGASPPTPPPVLPQLPPQAAPPPVAAAPPPQQPAMQAPPQVAPVAAMAPQPNPTEQLVAITAQSESRNRDLNPDGSVVTSPAGARGRMQVLDGTNRDPGFGVRPAQDDGLEERARVGRDYLMAMRDRYGGDMAKAWGAYNWGPGNLDNALATHGDGWLAHAPSETQAYVTANLRALNQSPQAAPPPERPEVPPYEVASIGPTPPPPSVPGSSPPVTGAPPAAPPQAAAGGNPVMYQPTQQEVAYVLQLLDSGDPAMEAKGEELAMQLRYKMTQPVKFETTTVNGLPAWLDPTRPGQMSLGTVPQQAMTQQVDARAFNPTARAGEMAQRDPLGNLKPGIGGPPENVQAILGPDGQLQYVPIKGSKDDPYRVQAPGPGYQYAPSGVQQAIPGSQADLKSPANVMDGANRYGGMVKTIVDSAMKVKQNYGAVVTGYRQQNGPGDIAMTNGIQKLIDDGVVKGEDVDMQMKANGLQGTLGSWAQYAKSGGVFTPAIRDMIHKTATDLYKNLDQTYRVRVQSLAPGFDEAYGAGTFGKYVFPQAFAEELGWTGEPGAAPAAAGPKPGGPAAAVQYPAALNRAHQNDVARGLYDPKAPLGSQKRPFLAADDAAVRAVDIPANKGKFVRLPSGDVAEID